jgi:tetratricopeptide (TPR) repeat protein
MAWSTDHDPSVGLRIGGAIWRFWQQRGHLAEGRERLVRLLDLAEADDDACALGEGNTALGGLLYWQGQHEAARVAYGRALDAYRSCGDELRIARAALNLSYSEMILGAPQSAAALLDEALQRYVSLGDARGVVTVKEGQTVAAMVAGDYDRARDSQEDVVAISARDVGLFKRADSIGLLGIIEALRGNGEAARRHTDMAFEINTELQSDSGYSGMLEADALTCIAEDRPEDAAFLSGALQGIRDDGQEVMVPSETMGFEDPAQMARQRLGEAFDAHYEAGRNYAPQEALERVRAQREQPQ